MTALLGGYNLSAPTIGCPAAAYMTCATGRKSVDLLRLRKYTIVSYCHAVAEDETVQAPLDKTRFYNIPATIARPVVSNTSLHFLQKCLRWS